MKSSVGSPKASCLICHLQDIDLFESLCFPLVLLAVSRELSVLTAGMEALCAGGLFPACVLTCRKNSTGWCSNTLCKRLLSVSFTPTHYWCGRIMVPHRCPYPDPQVLRMSACILPHLCASLTFD